MTANKPMTGEQLDELMAVAVRMQRDAEVDCNYPSANFAYAVQVAVLELRRTRDVSVALVAENATLKSAIQTHSESIHFCELCGKDDPCSTDDVCMVLSETPATDAFLAEVRAQGVDAAIEHLNKKFEGTGQIGVPVMALEWLAQEIRKGAAQ